MNLEALCKEVNLELYDSELTSENGKKNLPRLCDEALG